MNNEFNKYMEEFKKNSLIDKRKICIEQLKLIMIMTNVMCKKYGIDNEVIFNREIIDVKEGNSSEDDFVEAVVAYISSIQNSLCEFNDKLEDVLINK